MLNFVKSPIHKGLCFALAFIFTFLLLMLPVSAEGYSDIYPDTIGWKDGDSLITLVLSVLDSLGISFSSDGNSQDIYAFTQDCLERYIEEENQAWDEFWRLAQVGVDKLGNLLLNHTTAGKIYQFASWLINEYNLSSNSTTQLTSFNEDYIFPSGPIFLSSTPSVAYSYGDVVLMSVSSSDFPVLAFTMAWPHVEDPSQPFYTVVACSPVSGFYSEYFRTASGVENTFIWPLDSYDSSSGLYYSPGPGVTPSQWPAGFSTLIPFFDSLESGLSVCRSIISGSFYSVNVTLGDVNIPSLPPDSGLTVTVPGSEWGMTISQILDLIAGLIRLYDNTQLEIVAIVDTLENIIANLQTEVSVNNIPGGVVLDYDNYDVPLDSEWQIVDEFFLQGVQDDDTLFTPLDTLKYIIFGLPEPFIAFFSVIVIFTVAYGFIRMGRDSH